jgi:hypothetical protein
MTDFVKVVDASEQVHVINTRQIVRVYQNHPRPSVGRSWP